MDQHILLRRICRFFVCFLSVQPRQQATEACNPQLVTAVIALDMARSFDSFWSSCLREVCHRTLPQQACTCRWVLVLSLRAAPEGFGGSLPFPTFVPAAGVPQGSADRVGLIASPLCAVHLGCPLPSTACLGTTAFNLYLTPTHLDGRRLPSRHLPGSAATTLTDDSATRYHPGPASHLLFSITTVIKFTCIILPFFFYNR